MKIQIFKIPCFLKKYAAIFLLIISIMFNIFLYLENKNITSKTDELIVQINELLSIVKKNETKINEYEYIKKISEYYTNKSWENVINLTEEYISNTSKDMLYKESLLYLANSCYELYRKRKDTQFLKKSLENINLYFSYGITNALPYYIQGLVYLEYGDVDNLSNAYTSFTNADRINPEYRYSYHSGVALYRLSEKYSYKNLSNITLYTKYLHMASNVISDVIIKYPYSNERALKLINSIKSQIDIENNALR